MAMASKLQNRQVGWLVAPSTEYKCMKCKTNSLILILTLVAVCNCITENNGYMRSIAIHGTTLDYTNPNPKI